ncbi:hypothetical protein ABZ639_15365 [Saccharomonospora sp. NPDC006951]
MALTAMRSDAGAGLARRWLSRALLITGGAVAVTAAAWAVSTAAASAEPVASGTPASAEPNHHEEPLSLSGAAVHGIDVASKVLDPAGTRPPTVGKDAVDNAVTAVRAVGAAASGTGERGETGDSPGRLWERHVAAPVDRAVGSVGELVVSPPEGHQFGGDLLHILDPAEEALSPVLRELTGTEQQVGTPVKGGPATNADPKPSAAEVGDAAAKAGKTLRPAPTQFAQRQVSGDPSEPAGTVRHGGGSGPAGNGDWPGQHPTTMPAPLGGSTGGGHIDGSLYGVAARGVPAFDNTITGSALTANRYSPIQPGTQPGVTPD